MAYESKTAGKASDELFEAILALETVEECYRFFDDVCTIGEMVAIAQRFQVAKMLRKKATFNHIVAETGASTATISRVNRSLNYGSNGYNLILDRLAESEKPES